MKTFIFLCYLTSMKHKSDACIVILLIHRIAENKPIIFTRVLSRNVLVNEIVPVRKLPLVEAIKIFFVKHPIDSDGQQLPHLLVAFS